MIRRRYPSPSFLLEMDAAAAMRYLERLEAAATEERLFLRWVCGPQLSVSFADFKSALSAATDERSDAEILSDTAEIFARAEGK